jgi:hypothetical protein
MKIHVLIALTTCTMLDESRTATLDLDTASGFLLNMLHISSSMTDDLSSKVESRHWLKIDWDFLFGPLALNF